MVFLGAGASVPLGIGSLTEITRIVREDPNNSSILEQIDGIGPILTRSGIRFDIETVNRSWII